MAEAPIPSAFLAIHAASVEFSESIRGKHNVPCLLISLPDVFLYPIPHIASKVLILVFIIAILAIVCILASN